MLEKSTLGLAVVLISFQDLVHLLQFSDVPARYGVLYGIVGDFSADLTLSKLTSLPEKLAADVMSLSGLADGLGDAVCGETKCIMCSVYVVW